MSMLTIATTITGEMLLSKFCYPDWASTKLMVAAVFTKALDKTTFLKFRAVLLNEAQQ